MARAWDPLGEIGALTRTLGVPEPIIGAIEQLILLHMDQGRLRQRTGAGSPDSAFPAQIARLATHLHNRALTRVEVVGELLSDLAWTMLLHLTAEDAAGRGVPVSSLCLASGGPPTTALRNVAWLEQQGLVHRRADGTDGRGSLIFLSDEVRIKMHAAVLNTCVPLSWTGDGLAGGAAQGG